MGLGASLEGLHELMTRPGLAIGGLPLSREELLALAYFFILGACLYILARRRDMSRPSAGLVWLLIAWSSIGMVGHAIVAMGYEPRWPGSRVIIDQLSDLAILVTAIVIWPTILWLVRQPSRRMLKAEIDRQLRMLEELRAVHNELEENVAVRATQLNEAKERFDLVLRQSPVSVFSQDKELRYTWVRNPPPAYPESALGRTDVELLPLEAATKMTAVKRTVMDTGVARRTEVVLPQEEGESCYDLTVEPLKGADGTVIGTTSVAVDITHFKRSEELSEMLLRELTHRSKNLLAVIQSIARHTLPRTATGERFFSRLGGRLQALAITHDLLVDEGWRGVALLTLVRMHLGAYASRIGKDIVIEGPQIFLRPSAADSLGLVVHELADNASQYGALSGPPGRVSITWGPIANSEQGGVQFIWQETGGPAVQPPVETGFGRILVERAIGMSLGGGVKLDFAAEGVRCEIVLPANSMIRAMSHMGHGRDGPELPVG